jgi:hypothetical protein
MILRSRFGDGPGFRETDVLRSALERRRLLDASAFGT